MESVKGHPSGQIGRKSSINVQMCQPGHTLRLRPLIEKILENTKNRSYQREAIPELLTRSFP